MKSSIFAYKSLYDIISKLICKTMVEKFLEELFCDEVKISIQNFIFDIESIIKK